MFRRFYIFVSGWKSPRWEWESVGTGGGGQGFLLPGAVLHVFTRLMCIWYKYVYIWCKWHQQITVLYWKYNYELFAFGTKRNGPKQTICFCGKFLNFPAFSYDGSNPPGGLFIFGGLERTLVFTVDRFPMPVWRVGCEVFWLQKCHLLPALCKTNCQTFSGHSCLPNSPLSKIYSTSMPSPFSSIWCGNVLILLECPWARVMWESILSRSC